MDNERAVTFQCTRCGGDDIEISGIGPSSVFAQFNHDLKDAGAPSECELLWFFREWWSFDVSCRGCGKSPLVCRSKRIGLRLTLTADEAAQNIRRFAQLLPPDAEKPTARLEIDWESLANALASPDGRVEKSPGTVDVQPGDLSGGSI